MIAANSPLKYAAPLPARKPSPTRIRLRFACSDLSSRSSEPKPFSVGRSKLLWPRKKHGGWRSNDDSMVVARRADPDHLVIMVNGISGSALDWRFGAEQFGNNLPVLVHCSECNYARLTFDGVDTMGERLAKEVEEIVKSKSRKWPKLQKISFVAHSLGGLVARYAIGMLYSDPSGHDGSCLNKEKTNISLQLEQPCRGEIAGLQPMNFVTVATPHLGSKGHKQLPLLCGLPFLEKNAPQTAHLIAGRSGKHLFLTDEEKGNPLLLRMVNDAGDLKFISALRVFKRRVAYANANSDTMVGWRTSSIRRQIELPKLKDLCVSDERYPHIVYVQRESLDNRHSEVPSEEKIDWEEEMIRGLNQVSWERVDVSFQKSRQRFNAHNTIQVNRFWLNSDGADVVHHIIDNFLL